jgi:hypothetical protein
VAELTQLTTLALSATSITHKGVAHLKKLPNLQGICFARTALTDEACDHLAQMKSLTGFRLDNTRVRMRGLRKLKDLPNLVSLALRDVPLTQAEARELRNLMPKRVGIAND